MGRNSIIFPYFLGCVFLLFSIIIGIAVGTVYVPIHEIIQIIGSAILHIPLKDSADPMNSNIVMDIRMPRVLLAGMVGASLSIAGAAFQGLLRNPLADPYTLGVSSGASVGAVVTLFFHISIPFLGLLTLPFMSIVGSFFTIFCVLLFARKMEKAMKVETIILTGIIFSSFFSSFISLIIALTGDELRQIIGWLLGSVSMRGWSYVNIILPFFLIGSLLLLTNIKELNAMSLGEERAYHLGVNVEKRKLFVLIAGSILTGAAVSVSGSIGFVGLVIPHFIRIVWGPNHKKLLPLSILFGAGFLILADLISRTIIQPTELPIGVVTALIGAPVFAFILMKRKLGSRG
ncbi:MULTISPECIES: FecCD family ABC transporter permease [Heyndrickxia]|nr:iron ABC transporter permease [Heyndrickxia shackletonii]NEZ00941.1 iron ABC transporter permease [Heyndrickxia shackletonii]